MIELSRKAHSYIMLIPTANSGSTKVETTVLATAARVELQQILIIMRFVNTQQMACSDNHLPHQGISDC